MGRSGPVSGPSAGSGVGTVQVIRGSSHACRAGTAYAAVMSAPARPHRRVYEALGKLTYWTQQLEYETSVVLLALPDRGHVSGRDLPVSTTSDEALDTLVERTRYVPNARNKKRLRAFTNGVTESLRKSSLVIDQLTAHDAGAFAITRRAGSERDRRRNEHDALDASKTWAKDLIRLGAEARRIQKAIIRDNLR